jgi:hypothetical protein
MSASITARTPLNFKENFAAHSLNSAQRQEIAIRALGGAIPISHVADKYSVSRKFIYQQKEKALGAVSRAFEEKDNDAVLCYLPVTKKWIHQLVLALILIGRCSYDGVIEILRDIFDFSMSKGSVLACQEYPLSHLGILIPFFFHRNFYTFSSSFRKGICEPLIDCRLSNSFEGVYYQRFRHHLSHSACH